MTPLHSSIDFTTDLYKGNHVHNEQLLSELRDRLKHVHSGGPSNAVALHRKRGKLLAHERIATLLDPNST